MGVHICSIFKIYLYVEVGGNRVRDSYGEIQ